MKELPRNNLSRSDTAAIDHFTKSEDIAIPKAEKERATVQVWIIFFFKAQTDCPEKTMLRGTRWKLDQRSDNFALSFLKEFGKSRVSVALKTVRSYCNLINIKLMKAHVHHHPTELQQFLNRT